ncbi:MAG: uracil-DNA glycosylase [Planctomycetota bacterium]
MDRASLRRALLDRLDADLRAGLAVLPVGRPDARVALHTQETESVDEAASSPEAVTSRASVPMTSESSRRHSDPVPEGDPATRLQIVSDRVAGCRRCPELADSRTQTVFGVGDPEASILFLGEAPGADEDAAGEPFVGRAGQLLDRIIAACKLKREDIYICNVLKCRPPGNRNPLPIEADACREYLDHQLETVDPDYIVCWGKVAASNLLGVDTPIGRMRKKFFQHGRAKVACTYHPSYLLRNPSAKKEVWDDLKWLFADMGVELG